MYVCIVLVRVLYVVCVCLFISPTSFLLSLWDPMSRVPGLWSEHCTCRIRVSRSDAYRFDFCPRTKFKNCLNMLISNIYVLLTINVILK